jgi:ferredoxin
MTYQVDLAHCQSHALCEVEAPDQFTVPNRANAIYMWTGRALAIHDGTPEMPEQDALRRTCPATERD